MTRSSTARRRAARSALFLTVLAAAVASSAAIAAAPVIENGGFETGSLKGWKTSNTAEGVWSVYKGNSAALPPPPPMKGGNVTNTTPVHPPPVGKYAVASTENDPSTTILYQDFTVPKHARLKLFAYYRSDAPMTSQPDLNGEADDPATEPNQQYRIDLMKPSAGLRSVDGADILRTVFRTKTGDPKRLKPTKLNVDLSKLAGEKVRLRVAQTDNQNELAASVDGVKVVKPH